ncbi:MAG: hypothetical protein ACKON7_11585 [Planctomycetaceae bacterium]
MTPSTAPSIAWIGTAAGAELAWARRAVADVATVHEFAGADDVVAAPADGPWPAVALVGSDRGSRWGLPDLTAISRRWPLTPVVSVAASIVDGRRRSGPLLPATEEVPWSEVPARLAWWFADRAAGRPGTLGLPATARREERAVEAVAALRPTSRSAVRVSVAADRAVDLEGLADLITASGREVLRRTCGRPPLDEPADVLVWDTAALGPTHLAWLGMLAANRPELAVIVVDSFPRPETALAALEAGAAAVLGRPLAPESLAGSFVRLESAPATGLGGPPPSA